MSAIEALTSTAIGYTVAVLTQLAVFPLFGLPADLGDSLAIGAIFTVVSVARSYAVRRLFERFRSEKPHTLPSTQHAPFSGVPVRHGTEA
jgi:hypothetical protein